MATQSSILSGKSYGQKSLAGYILWDCKRRNDLMTKPPHRTAWVARGWGLAGWEKQQDIGQLYKFLVITSEELRYSLVIIINNTIFFFLKFTKILHVKHAHQISKLIRRLCKVMAVLITLAVVIISQLNIYQFASLYPLTYTILFIYYNPIKLGGKRISVMLHIFHLGLHICTYFSSSRS